MKILIVCSGNKGKINPFITEQAASLAQLGIDIDVFTIQGKGVIGYLANFFKLKRTLGKKQYQLVHAHYGLSGLLAGLQRSIPVITTFHGSDIKQKKILRLSRIAARLSKHNIVVEKSFKDALGVPDKTSVIPCGIDLNVFEEADKETCRKELGFDSKENLVLFTSAFGNPVKNYPLAKKAIELSIYKPRLIELKNFSRKQVQQLMNAADVLLMTSFSEGSPQVVKESVACRLPVVSTPVGDVPYLSELTDGIAIASYEAQSIARKIDRILEKKERISDNSFIKKFDNREIAAQIQCVYKKVIT